MSGGPKYRCAGCGEYVEPDHGSEGAWGHTVQYHVCGGNEEQCWRQCPEMAACGPVELVAAPDSEGAE
jgi:hypothetical protein